MAADQLGQRMHDDVRAKFERPAEQGGERVVDRQEGIFFVGDPRKPLQVGQSQEGIGQRLDPDQSSSGRDHVAERFGPCGVEEAMIHAESGHLAGQDERLAVQLARERHLVARTQAGEEDRALGAHPGGANQARFGPF